MTFRIDTFRGADGDVHQRMIVQHPGAVSVLAIDGEDVLLVHQFRGAVDVVCLEIPAGTLDRDDAGAIEDPDLAAPRELAEETGFRAETWRKLGRFYTAPGFASEEMHLYLATGLTPLPGYAGPPEEERLEVERIPWHDAVRRCETGDISDAKSIVALFWLERLALRGEL